MSTENRLPLDKATEKRGSELNKRPNVRDCKTRLTKYVGVMVQDCHHARRIQSVGRGGLLSGPGFRGRIEDVNRIWLFRVTVDHIDGVEVLGGKALGVRTIKGPFIKQGSKKNQN
jgi:hypothetical protein